jgi:hypothetical protein
MANSASHAALPYPIKGARYTIQVPYLDADGDPTDPTTPDTEISKDGAAAADCAEEVTTISGSIGMGYLTLTGAETDCSMAALIAKVASGPKATLMTIYPRVLASVGTGTLSAGSAGGGTLGTLLAYDVTGCFIKTTGGTGGGGTGGANNQVRKIATYNVSTGVFTVVPNWETTPDNTTTYEVLLPEGVTLGMLRTLNPTTAGRTLDVSAGGEAGIDWSNVGSPGATVNLSSTNIDQDQVIASVTGNVGGNVAGSVLGDVAGNLNGSVGSLSLGAQEDVRDAVGLATPNLDTQLSDLQGGVDDIEAAVGFQITGTVVDLTPTTTSFTTDQTGSGDDFFVDMLFEFTSGNLLPLSRPIKNYVSATGEFIFDADDAWPAAPTNGSAWRIRPSHVHPVSQIAEASAEAVLIDPANKLLTNASGHVTPVATSDDAVLQAIEDLTELVSDLSGGASETLVISAGEDCNTVQRFDAGEKRAVGASLTATGGTLTLSEVKVTLEDGEEPPNAVYGISNVNATEFDSGAQITAQAFYELDTVNPPDDGPIAVGAYNLVFKFTGTSSDGSDFVREVHITIVVE